jgi:hypothetical protein
VPNYSIAKPSTLVLLLFLVALSPLAAQSQAAAACSNSSLNGAYFYLLAGAVEVSGSGAEDYAELGMLVANGQGSVSGKSNASTGGTLQSLTFSGTYAVQANCTGTMNVIINSQASEALTFQIVEGGQQAVEAFSSSGGVVVGRAYRAASQCGNQSLSGTYGWLLSGEAKSGGTTYGFSDAGQGTFDGNGGLTFASSANFGAGASQISGTGTYAVASDCSGIMQATDQDGTANYTIAATADNGLVLFLETDTGTSVSGTLQPQSLQLVLPQFVFGGGWYSALYFTNTNSSAVSFTVNFTSDAATPLTVPSLGGTSATVSLSGNGTAILQAPNAGSLSEGYATFVLPAGVTGYGLFRQSVPGSPDQEAVVPFSGTASTTSILTFDETAFTTGIAIVNPSAVAATIAITAYGTDGSVIGTSSVSLPPYGKTEAALRNLTGLSGIVGQQGSAQFVASTGTVAVLGLRFGAIAFTSIPTVQQ